MNTDLTPDELVPVRATQRRLLALVASTLAAVAVALAIVAAFALSSASAAAAGPPAVTVIGWDPERDAITVWRGLTELRESRVLPRARVAALARAQGAVAFVQRAPGGFDVSVTGTQSGTERRLARVAGRRPTSIAITPDARLVAFPSARGLETLSTLGARRVLALPASWRGSFFDALAFSPDGSLLAFSRVWRDGRTGALRNELGVIRRDGSGARALVANPRPIMGRYRPTFTPDGRQILFTAADRSLALVPAQGGRVTRVTTPPARHGDYDPVVSRDGAWVAFTRVHPADAGGSSDVYVVRPSGAELRRVTTTPLPASPDLPAIGSVTLAWSPDGTKLLTRRHDRLAVVDLSGGAGTELARVGFRYAVRGANWNP